ncbi:MAG: hypothetical protein ACJAR2_000952 [Ilumatobacter sp.]|jgi:hypothetical protein
MGQLLEGLGANVLGPDIAEGVAKCSNRDHSLDADSKAEGTARG